MEEEIQMKTNIMYLIIYLEKIKSVVDAAKKNNCAIRIGVNAGSLEKEFIDKYYRATPEAMLASALKHVKILESLKFYNTKISVKASNVQLAIDSYKLLAKATISFPLKIKLKNFRNQKVEYL